MEILVQTLLIGLAKIIFPTATISQIAYLSKAMMSLKMTTVPQLLD